MPGTDVIRRVGVRGFVGPPGPEGPVGPQGPRGESILIDLATDPYVALSLAANWSNDVSAPAAAYAIDGALFIHPRGRVTRASDPSPGPTTIATLPSTLAPPVQIGPRAVAAFDGTNEALAFLQILTTGEIQWVAGQWTQVDLGGLTTWRPSNASAAIALVFGGGPGITTNLTLGTGWSAYTTGGKPVPAVRAIDLTKQARMIGCVTPTSGVPANGLALINGATNPAWPTYDQVRTCDTFDSASPTDSSLFGRARLEIKADKTIVYRGMVGAPAMTPTTVLELASATDWITA